MSNICEARNCEREIEAVNWCNRHYENWRLRGNPIPRRDWTIKEIIEDIGWDIKENGCWEWKGVKNWSGYGLVSLKRLELDNARAHRVVFEELTKIKIGDKVLCHHCDNPPCVNPKHLFIGTMADNVNDMVKKGRHWAYGRKICKNKHDLTAEGAVKKIIRKDGRKENICIQCDRNRKRNWESKSRLQKALLA